MSENLPPDSTERTPPDAEKPKPRKRRWRRLIVIAAVAVPVLGLIGIALLPTILSLGPVRSIALSVAGPKIAPNGSVAVEDWSFSWFGGQTIRGVTLYDDQKAAVAHLNIETGASLLALARGDLDLKQTSVTGDFDVRIDPDTGRVNVLHILGQETEAKPEPKKPADPNARKPAPKPAPTPEQPEPIQVPALKGVVTINMNGTVSSTDPRDASIPFTKIEKANLVLDLQDINQGIGIDALIAATIDGKPARVSIKGMADAIENHAVVFDMAKLAGSPIEQLAEIDKLAAKLDVSVEQVDLSILNAFMNAGDAATATKLSGLLGGTLAINLVPGGAGSIQSTNLGIDDLQVVAPALKGDTFISKRIDLPIAIERAAGTGLITIASTGLRSDVATIDVAGTLPQAAIQNLADGRAPGAAGQIVVNTKVPSFQTIAAMLPNTIGLQQGVVVTDGELSDVLTIRLIADGIEMANALKLDAEGTSDGKAIRLEPTSLDTNVRFAINAGVPIDEKAVRELSVDLKAPFAMVKGGGTLGKLQLDGNADLGRLTTDVGQFVALDGLDLRGKATFSLATDGDATDLTKPLGVKLNFNAADVVVVNSGQTFLDGETIKGDIDALYRETPTARLITTRKLTVGSDSGLFGLWTAGDAAWVSLPITNEDAGIAAGSVGGEGEFHFRTNKLDRVLAMAGIAGDEKTRVTRGVVDTIATIGTTSAGDAYTVALKTDVTKLDIGDALGNEAIAFVLNATLPADLTSTVADFSLKSSFATIAGKADAMLKTADGKDVPTLAMVRSATIDGDVPSVEKLYRLATSISPPAVENDPVTGQPLPPMELRGGSARFTSRITRDEAKGLTTLNIDVPAIRDLMISRGAFDYSIDKPITFTAKAALATNLVKPELIDQIAKAVVTIDLIAPGLATVQTPTPIELTGLAQETPEAKGTLRTTASLGGVFRLLSAMNGTEPTALSGEWAGDQTLSSGSKGVKLTGSGQLTELTPTGPEATPLPEAMQTIALTNDLTVDLKTMAFAISKAEAFAPAARDALSLSVTGNLREVGTTNVFENVQAIARYDAPQLWPLVQPIVDPTGESLGKVEQIEGKYSKTFTVSGSYPTARADGTLVPSTEAIRSLVVTGNIELGRAALTDKGLEVANLSLPISLKDGVVKIATADGKPPTPFDINSGKGDLSDFSVNLTGDEPVLGDLKKKRVIRGATLNPILSNALGKFFNPLFPNATKATAIIDLTLSTTKLKLGESLMTDKSGKAVAVLSLRNLEIRNPLSEELLGKFVNGAASALKLGGGVNTDELTNLRGEMRDATFTLDRGVVTQDATFMIGNEGQVDEQGNPKRYAFTFAGDVALDDLAMNLSAGFPVALLKDKIRGDVGKVLAFAPDRFTFGLTGSTTDPKPDLSGLGRLFTEAGAKYLASRALGGDRNNSSDDGGKKSDLEKGIDILDGLLNKNKK